MVAKKKVEARKKLAKIIKDSKSVLIFDLANMPSGQLHELRNTLKEKEVYTYIAKKRVIQKAIEDTKVNLNVEGSKQPAIIYSNKGIFEVSNALKQVKTKRKAKAGETCPEEIKLPAGPTPAQAGPAISIFKTFQIQTMIKDGKISIREPKVVCKVGDKIPLDLISLLNMLSITPIEMSISPKGGYSENLYFASEILDMNSDYLTNQILVATGNITKVTFKIGYPTKQNANLLLTKGWMGAKALGIRTGMPSKELMGELLRVAHTGAKKLEK
jgi:large subunit ribosomal protein L10